MKELVRIEESVIGAEKRKTVNARDLWKALGSRQEFANWIKDRLSEFIEGQDFTVDKIVNGRDSSGRFTAKNTLIPRCFLRQSDGRNVSFSPLNLS